MGLIAMLDEALNGEAMTMTVATPATVKSEMPPSVATVATVTVAGGPNPEAKVAPLMLVHSANRRSEREATLYVQRVHSFQGKGITNHDAAALAKQLVMRDRRLDDRRSCAECLNFYAGLCRQQKQPFGGGGIMVLHRCMDFERKETDQG